MLPPEMDSGPALPSPTQCPLPTEVTDITYTPGMPPVSTHSSSMFSVLTECLLHHCLPWDFTTPREPSSPFRGARPPSPRPAPGGRPGALSRQHSLCARSLAEPLLGPPTWWRRAALHSCVQPTGLLLGQTLPCSRCPGHSPPSLQIHSPVFEKAARSNHMAWPLWLSG